MDTPAPNCPSCGMTAAQPCDRPTCPVGHAVAQAAQPCALCGLSNDKACSLPGCPAQQEKPEGVDMAIPACPSCGMRTRDACDRARCALA